MTKNALDSLRDVTKIVVDSSNFKSIAKFSSIDATTNPSLLIKSIGDEDYKGFIKQVSYKYPNLCNKDIAREVIISFAEEILKVITGRVSIEVDPSVAFNSQRTELEALKIIESCSARNISLKRVLIKIPATWEGILAAKKLEKKNIGCNLTLLFSQVQAVACADAGVKMISPFVGRISDWWKKQGLQWGAISDDPGVKFVRSVYFHLKKKKYSTEVMAASFRSIDQIFSLAGLDLLTISPSLLSTMMQLPPQKDLTSWINNFDEQNPHLSELNQSLITNQINFLNVLANDEMANEKLIEGINIFKVDNQKLVTAVESENQISSQGSEPL